MIVILIKINLSKWGGKKMKLSYPTVFHREDNDTITVRIPDAQVATMGIDFGDAIIMANEALQLVLDDMETYPEATILELVQLEEWEDLGNTTVREIIYEVNPK